MAEQDYSLHQIQEKIETLKQQEAEEAWTHVEEFASDPGLEKALALSDHLKERDAKRNIEGAQKDLAHVLKDGNDVDKELARSEFIAAKVNLYNIESHIQDRQVERPGYSTAIDQWREKISSYEKRGGNFVSGRTEDLLKGLTQRVHKSH